MQESSDMSFHSLPVFLVTTTPDAIILMMNEPMRQTLGVSHEEVVGESLIQKYMAENSRADARDLIRRALDTGHCVSSEICFRIKSGGEALVEWQVQPVLRESGEPGFLFGLGLDITARKEMERRLFESERRYRSLFHDNYLPILLIDPENTDIVDANPAACRFYGYPPETLTKMKITSINTLPADRVYDELTRAVFGEKNHFQFRHRLSDGALRDVEVYCGQITVAEKSLVYAILHDMTARKRMEEELMREREEQLLMFDSVPAMIFYKNKRNRFVRVNKAFSRLLDLPKESIEGATVEEIIPELAEKNWREDLEVIETGHPKRSILDIFDTPHGPCWIQTDKIPFRDEKGEIIGVLGFSVDITEPKRTGEAIRALLDGPRSETDVNSFDRIVIRIREWLGVDCSLVIRVTAGARAEVLSMQADNEPVSPFGFRTGGTIFETVLQEEYLYFAEGAGSRFPTTEQILRTPVEGFAGVAIRDRNGEPMGCICIISGKRLLLPKRTEEVLRIFAANVSLEMERIRSETALRESEERYRALVETSPDAIVMIDLRGYVVTANRRFAELLGAGRMEEVIASHKMVFEYLGDGERIRAKKDSDMLLDGSCTVTNQEYTVNRFDGSTIPVEIGMSLLRDEHGEPGAYIGIVRNITERKEAERRHAEAMKMAERSSRLASVGTLAAGISHEINQPLTALKVKVDSMLYWKEMNVAIPQEDFDQDLRFISQQTERIDDIIKHMRALARQEKGQDPVDISLNGVIGDVIPLLRQRISAHGIQLVQNLDPALPPVRGHKTLLQQVVINLMVNAVNALDESKKNEKKITVSTRHNHSQCFLEIVDNGIGISEEYLNQIFDPFFTTRIGGEGMGLGLSICHNIVTGLGGTVTVENNRDGGARFLVSIPISRAGEEGQ